MASASMAALHGGALHDFKGPPQGGLLAHAGYACILAAGILSPFLKHVYVRYHCRACNRVSCQSLADVLLLVS
jgi:hypothetical protein